MATAIWWIRRDLRLHDNQALQSALSRAETVIPVYILDEHLLVQEAPLRQAFLFNALHSLSHDLESLGSSLVVRRGKPGVELTRLHAECGANWITAEADYSPYATARDRSISHDLPLELTTGVTIQPPGAAVKADGLPYTVFTPFSRAWLALPSPGDPLPSPNSLKAHLPLSSQPIPEAHPIRDFPANEKYAQRRLCDFIQDGIGDYHTERDRLDLEGTSYVSPYLRFGLLSPRYVYAQIKPLFNDSRYAETQEGAASWRNELIWREFYFNILNAFPFVLKGAFRRKLNAIPWRNALDDLQAWQAGMTGFPVVDAGLRHLAHTGWMHNRARMITASFLVKDLLINWQAGEAWFMRSLIDGDPASNNGGWQWTAGTGTDAAPFFRVFSPVRQSIKFDPRGSYIREWVPELENVPDKYIHEPWKMPASVQSQVGVQIGKDYPAPLVDHKSARDRALAAYRSV